MHAGAVDFGQAYGDAHAVALVDGSYIAVAVVQAAVQHRRHIFQGVMGFEIRRPVGNQAVTDAVGFVESVAGEGFNEVENLGAHLAGVALPDGAGNEAFPLLGHQLGDFLAHSLADGVGFAQRVAGEVLQDVEHLVLINDDAVGFVQQFFHTGVRVGDFRAAVLGTDEAVDVFHRAGAVKGNHRGDVAQVGGFQFPDVALHSRAFQLEQVGGVAGA